MCPPPFSFTTIKNVWPALLFILATAAVLAVSLVFQLRGCSSPGDDPSFVEDARDGVLDDVAAHRAENDHRIEQLAAEIYDLNLRLEAIDAELAESIIEREEIHHAIQDATSIDDIDRVLRAGIPGISGGR